MDVIGDKGDHSGPIELATYILDCLGDAWVPSKVVIMIGVQNVQLDRMVVGDIKQSLVAKEVAIL